MKTIQAELQELRDTNSFLTDAMLKMIQSDEEHSDSTILGLINSVGALERKLDEIICELDGMTLDRVGRVKVTIA